MRTVEIDLGQVDLNVDEINYDIDELRNQICVEDTGVYIPTDGIAKGNDAYTLLEWQETRNLLLNDLVKVEKITPPKMLVYDLS
jgi:hypothetical protein